VAKVTINGEMFDFDQTKRPMLEALTIEHELKMRYADWETELQGGSVKALVGFVWMVWHRDGRLIDGEPITVADILSGKAEVNLAEVNIEADEGEADPTTPPPDPSPTTAPNTAARSPKRSA
jgi:hypothetical protein